MSVSFLILLAVKTVLGWYIAMGAVMIIEAISYPLRLAISLDAKQPTISFWAMREFFLNLGRAVTLGISWIFFMKELYWPVFVLFAGIALVYPLLIQKKLKGLH